MEELNIFQIFTSRILYLIGWLVRQLSLILIGSEYYVGFNSPLLWLTIGLFFAFACLHIFKRILRKG